MIIGIFCSLFGLTTIVARIFKPSLLGKLVAFQTRYGKKWGSVIHFISYSVIPLVTGISFIITGR